MGVVGDRLDPELDHDDAPNAAHDLGSAGQVDAAALDQRPVDLANARAEVEQLVEVAAAVLLLAFNEEADLARQGADGGEVGLDAPDARHQLALVVGGAPSVEAPIANRRLVRRRRPELVRHGRLDVVVLNGVEGPGAFANLADDERRHAVLLRQADDIDGGPERPETVLDPPGGAREALRLSRLGWEAAELGQLVRPPGHALVDVPIESRVIAHVCLLSIAATIAEPAATVSPRAARGATRAGSGTLLRSRTAVDLAPGGGASSDAALRRSRDRRRP